MSARRAGRVAAEVSRVCRKAERVPARALDTENDPVNLDG